MRKYIIGLLSVLFVYTASAQRQGYVVKHNGDTLKGNISLVLGGPQMPMKVVVKSETKGTHRIKAKNLQAMCYGGDRFFLKQLKPDSDKNKSKDLLQIVLEDKDNVVYSKKFISPNYSSGPANKYYLYVDNEFVGYINKRNYKDTIPKYFPKYTKAIVDKGLKFEHLFEK